MEATNQPAATELLAFGQRLQDLLDQIQQNQAWLATTLKVERSTISRFISGERIPSLPMVQDMAVVFGVTIEELVRGTNIEARIAEAGREASKVVRRSDYEAVLKQVVQYEGEKNELEAKLRDAATADEQRRNAAQRQLQAAHHEIERHKFDLDAIRAAHGNLQDDNRRLRVDLGRFRSALGKAVTDLAAHKRKIEELADLVRKVNEQAKAGNKLSQIGAVLAGVAAFTGVVTLATFLGGDEKAKGDASGEEHDGDHPE